MAHDDRIKISQLNQAAGVDPADLVAIVTDPDGNPKTERTTIGDIAAIASSGTPTSHASTHATAGTDPITPASIGAATAAQGSLADTAVQPAALSQYAPRDADTFIPAQAFSIITDSPVLGPAPAARATGWTFGTSGTPRVSTFVRIPAGWSTIRSRTLWANATTATGDVSWQRGIQAIPAAVSDLTVAPGLTAAPGEPALGQWVAQIGPEFGPFAVTGGATHRIWLGRAHAGLASDTLAGNVVVYGLTIVRAS